VGKGKGKGKGRRKVERKVRKRKEGDSERGRRGRAVSLVLSQTVKVPIVNTPPPLSHLFLLLPSSCLYNTQAC
jgi:hypothetical protein